MKKNKSIQNQNVAQTLRKPGVFGIITTIIGIIWLLALFGCFGLKSDLIAKSMLGVYAVILVAQLVSIYIAITKANANNKNKTEKAILSLIPFLISGIFGLVIFSLITFTMLGSFGETAHNICRWVMYISVGSGILLIVGKLCFLLFLIYKNKQNK